MSRRAKQLIEFPYFQDAVNETTLAILHEREITTNAEMETAVDRWVRENNYRTPTRTGVGTVPLSTTSIAIYVREILNKRVTQSHKMAHALLSAYFGHLQASAESPKRPETPTRKEDIKDVQVDQTGSYSHNILDGAKFKPHRNKPLEPIS